MADAVTIYGDLIKPEIGASGATWGLKWNQNADKIATKLADRPGKLEIGQMAELGEFDGTELVVMFQTTGEDEDRVVSATGAMKWTTLLERVAEASADRVGDWKDSWRDLTDEGYLRRNGALHLRSAYPELSAMAPSLPDSILFPETDALNLRSVVWDGSRYVGVTSTDQVYESTDGDTWNLLATISGSLGAYAITYGNGLYLICGGSGEYSRSSNGTTWSAPARVAGTPASSFGWNTCKFGNGIFTMAGSAGNLYTSLDLVSWTSRSSGTAAFIVTIEFVNNTFILLGTAGYIGTSTDGITWTPRTSGVATSLNGAAYGNSLYVIVGDAGVILTSSNLISWTPRSGGSGAIYRVRYSSAGFVCSGSTTAFISSNATSWTSVTLPKAIGSVVDITIDNTFPDRYMFNGPFITGVRTSPDKFQVPNDNAAYGWIKAEYPEAA